MLIIHKYTPDKIDDFIYHRDVIENLLMISKDESIPHIIINGPPGSGKKSIVNYYLRMLYDDSVRDLRKEKYTITGSSNKKEISITKSNFHIIIEPTITNYDKHVIQEIVIKYAMSSPLPYLVNNRTFKTIVINNAEKLSNLAQTALRRTMETYAKTCRFIMICNNLSKILDPLKSRCCVFQVALPTKQEVYNNINYISVCENIDLKESDYVNILSTCGRSMKKAIWMLEEIRLGIKIKPSTDVIMNHIIYYIMTTTAENYIDHIQKIRMEIYELIITNIRGSDIICDIVDCLIKTYDSDVFLFNVIRIASVSEFNLIQGRRDIMHIDYFIVRVTALLVKMKSNPLTSGDFPVPLHMEIRDKSKKIIEPCVETTLDVKNVVAKKALSAPESKKAPTKGKNTPAPKTASRGSKSASAFKKKS